MHQGEKQSPEKKNGWKRQKMNPKKRLSPAYSLTAPNIWIDGIRGQRVKVAVFDTGISRSTLGHFNSLIDSFDWTDEEINNDVVGHGTFVAGVIASNHEQCPGIAPDAELYSFRIFNKKRSNIILYFIFIIDSYYILYFMFIINSYYISYLIIMIHIYLILKCVIHHGS